MTTDDGAYKSCPYCSEPDFDVDGLEIHLATHCEAFDQHADSDTRLIEDVVRGVFTNDD